MHHLMRQRILQVSSISHLVRTNPYPVLWIKGPSLSVCAAAAVDIVRGDVTTQVVNVLAEEADYRTFSPQLALVPQ